MYKILIVEDETLIKEGIADGIEWNNIECDLPSLAENGLEAIEVIKNNIIDIVITDVKMPGMGGLELARWISDNRDEICVIILSGYDNFEFVQSAINCGVVSEYILKPTKFDELVKSIEKVKGKIMVRRKIYNEYHKAKEVLKDISKKVLIDNFVFERIVDAGELHRSLNNWDMYTQLYRITVVQIYYNTSDDFEDNSYILDFARDIGETARCTAMKLSIDCYIQYEKDEVLIYHYSEGSNMKAIKFASITNKAVVELSSTLKDMTYLETYIGISGLGRDIHNLKELYLEATRKCDAEKQKKRYRPNNLAKDISISKALSKHLDDYLKNKDYQNAGYEFEAMINRISDTPITYQKSLAIEIMNYCAALLEKDIKYEDMRNRYEAIINAVSSKDIVTGVKEALREFCLSFDKLVAESEINIERSERIKNYIKRYFYKDLTLEQVAKGFYISPGHLSRLLSKSDNMTFVDILTGTRMENAKTLLKNQRYKVYEVARMVGFRDSKYFSQVFRKNTGMRPSEYKEGREK